MDNDEDTRDPIHALVYACFTGNYEVAAEILARDQHMGPSLLNLCLKHACRAQNIKLAKHIIAAGADDLEYAIIGACDGRGRETIDFVLSRYDEPTPCLNAACSNGIEWLANLMVSRGADKYAGIWSACLFGYHNLAHHLLQGTNLICAHCGNAADTHASNCAPNQPRAQQC